MSTKWWRGVYTGVLEAVAGDRVLRSLLGFDLGVATLCAVAALALGRQQRTLVLLLVGSTLCAGALLTWFSLSWRRYSPALLLSVVMMAALVNGLVNVAMLGCECEPPQCRGLELFAHWAVPPVRAEEEVFNPALSFVQMGQTHAMTMMSAKHAPDPTVPPRVETPPGEAPAELERSEESTEEVEKDVVVEVDAEGEPQGLAVARRLEAPDDGGRPSMAEVAEPQLTRRVEPAAAGLVGMIQDAHAAGPPQAARLLCAMLRALLMGVLGVHAAVLVLRSHALYTLVKKVKDASLAEARVGILADILAPDPKPIEEDTSSDTDHDPPGIDRRSESDGEAQEALEQWRAKERPGGGAGSGDHDQPCD